MIGSALFRELTNSESSFTDGRGVSFLANVTGTPHSVGIEAPDEFTDLTSAIFRGVNPAQWSHSPAGTWEQWVSLARLILKAEENLTRGAP